MGKAFEAIVGSANVAVIMEYIKYFFESNLDEK
jgi:hypothetical protein